MPRLRWLGAHPETHKRYTRIIDVDVAPSGMHGADEGDNIFVRTMACPELKRPK